ncbi:hypothetical protein Dsin_020862 [Dipteronia sinensis]|uniref:Uncharacterized protein n=1 Tax=Dipteronia sinensis TaxID=43782 RepID=A0AAE0E4D6_9ROSI|nr:hypothetical protein Dsin_020862 [Dipteronia sinensis]
MEKSHMCEIWSPEWFKLELETCFQCFSLRESVGSLFDKGSATAKILKDGINVVVGNGEKTKFWSNLWWDNITLKTVCPRTYALFVNEDGFVNDFGRWTNSSWVWEVPLRRHLFV